MPRGIYRLSWIVFLTMSLFATSLTMAQSTDLPKPKLALTSDEQKNIAAYVRNCEIDQLQLTFCEKSLSECEADLKWSQEPLGKIVGAILLIGAGYWAGSQ